MSHTLVLRRRYRAPGEKVFAAWTIPEQVAQWLHPGPEWQNPVVDIDLRVGGKYRFGFQKDGESNIDYVGGFYREIIANRRLVFTWCWEPPNEHAGIETIITVEFNQVDSDTEVVIQQVGFLDNAMKLRHSDGWSGALDQLQCLRDPQPSGENEAHDAL